MDCPTGTAYIETASLKVHAGNLDKKGEKKIKVLKIFIYLDSVDLADYYHGSFSPIHKRFLNLFDF